jgi:predicted dehydrogenase
VLQWATMRTIRWGVLATGGIASRFAEDLRLVPDARAVAVASRTPEAAARFAQTHGIDRTYGSWQALAEDPEVDIVYVGTPHVAHHQAAKLMLTHGKAVLCEKPVTINADQAHDLVDTARANNVFFAEALWTRTIPAVLRMMELIKDGAIGEVGMVTADFSRHTDVEPGHRLRDPRLGGGALLDLGVYPIGFAQMVLGDPAGVQAVAKLSPEGVDQTAGVLLTYPNGATAMATCSLAVDGSTTATVSGTDGRIDLPPGFHNPSELTLHRDGSDQRETYAYEGNGLRFQAIEAGRCLREGLIESPLLPLADTLTVMRTMDRARVLIGVTYPDEV